MVPGNRFSDLRRIRKKNLHPVGCGLPAHQSDGNAVAVQLNTQMIVDVPVAFIHLLVVIIHPGGVFNGARPIDRRRINIRPRIILPALIPMPVYADVAAVFLCQGSGLAGIQVPPVIVGRQLVRSISGSFRAEVYVLVGIVTLNCP